MWIRFLLFSLALAAVPARTSAGEPSQWRQFRGYEGRGVARSGDVTFDLNVETNLVWRTPTPEWGWSSPLTDGERLWFTSARTTDATAEQKAAVLEGAKFAGQKDVAGRLDLIAYCLDAATGEVIFKRELKTIDAPGSINFMNSYASPTGVWVDGRVVLHFGRYGTWCLDADSGQVLWNRTLSFDDSMGPGSSVVESDGVIVVTCDGMDVQFVAGLSLATGEVLWRTPRPPIEASHGEFRKSYSTPIVIDVAGRRQAIVPGAQWCVAYNPADGREWWRVRHGKGFSISPTPVFADGKLIFATGYGNKELIAVDPTGTGDVTETHVVWRTSRGVPVMPSVTVVDNLIFSLADGGVLAALRLDDGSVVWQKRLGGKYSASPFASGDRLAVANHAGLVTVFRANDRYEEIAQYDLGEQFMASPIAIGNDLVVRTKAAVYRFSPRSVR